MNPSPQLPRRDFVKTVAGGSAALAATTLLGTAPTSGVAVPPAKRAAAFPKGRIGDLSLSRLMFGGNITNAWMHARDLKYVSALARRYNTDEKIDETFQLAEAHGIDTAVGGARYIIRHVQRYNERRNGAMKVIGWFSTTDPADLREEVQTYHNAGVSALFFNGAEADRILRAEGPKAMDKIARAADIVRDHGLPVGMAAHDLRTIELCEKHHGVSPDFYFKTLHHHRYPSAPARKEMRNPDSEVPGYWCNDPDAVIRFMQDTRKPWIAFKILAAGAIPPQDAFPYAFHSGADFICVGMFDFQVKEDCRLAADAIHAAMNRNRPWCS